MKVKALLEPHGLVSMSVEEGVVLEPPGPKETYRIMACLTFPTLEALERAMTACGAELTRDFFNFTDVRPLIQVNRVVSG